jgi:deoxyribonuclease-4
MALLGAHESVAGGLHLAFARIKSVGGEALQIFSRNQRQWHPAPLTEEEIFHWKQAWSAQPTMPVASHGSYLVNLASPKPEVAAKSVINLILEIERCAALAIPYVVIHPGSHGGDGIEAGLNRFLANMDQCLASANEKVSLLLETTAGQGTGLGSSFAELGYLLAHSRFTERLGVCIDTCHIFAAGYELRSAPGYDATVAELTREVGLDRVRFFHLNDSKKQCGSKVDRHEHIGKGEIGLDGFRRLLNDPRFRHLPMTLETPKGEDLHEDRENLATLRSLYV